MSEDLHQEEEVKTTPPTGDDSESDFDFESLFADESDPEAEKTKFLAQVNKVEGRDYKTIEDWSKTNLERKKIADKFYSEQGRKKEEAKPEPKPSEFKYAEKLLTIENPKAKFVMDEIKEISKDKGLDPIDVWEKFSWIRKEAESRAEEAETKEKTEKKVSKPSQKISGTSGGGELSEAERALLARRPGLLEKYNKSKQ